MLLLLLAGFVIATPLVGGHVFVASALGRSEFYAGLAADLDRLDHAAPDLAARVARNVHAHAHKATGKLTMLNLYLHLSGIAAWSAPVPPSAGAGAALRAVVGVLPRWLLVFTIFEPPWGRRPLR